MREIRRVCVYCASSRQADPVYAEAAGRLGRLLAREGATVVYGGAAIGSMRALADGALAEGGRVVGVLPRFISDMELAHAGLSELVLVDGLHERKQRMIEGADAVVALPGGSGTLEELLEAITWKRLGLFLNPIVIVNQAGFYDALLRQFQQAVDGRFMDARHLGMWTVVGDVDEVVNSIKAAPDWGEEARRFAAP